jgi:hypothetical protein
MLHIISLISPNQRNPFFGVRHRPSAIGPIVSKLPPSRTLGLQRENNCSSKDQLTDIRQQCQRNLHHGIPFNVLDPVPGKQTGPFPVCQTDDQQLMRKTNFRSIHDQTYLLMVIGLTGEPTASNWLIPNTHIDSRVSQPSAQVLDKTVQPGFPRDLSDDPVQVHRTALVNTNDQPGKIEYVCESLRWLQLSNPHNMYDKAC